MVIGVPTPNPTCVEPRPAPIDWVTRSWKETTLPLNPGVLRFARLLPTTSIAVVSALSAESAVEKDVSIMSSGLDLSGIRDCSGSDGRGGVRRGCSYRRHRRLHHL